MAEKTQETNNEEEEKSTYERLNNTQKCAILMMLLGEEEASEILKNLGPKEVQQLGKEMYNVQGLDQDTVNRVLDEFLAIIKTQTDLGMGSTNYIRNVMTKALGENKAQSVLGRITPTESDKPIEILDWMDARSVAELISDEHPQIMALIISYLEPGVAADVLTLLPEETQSDIIHRIATLETVLPIESLLPLVHSAVKLPVNPIVPRPILLTTTGFADALEGEVTVSPIWNWLVSATETVATREAVVAVNFTVQTVTLAESFIAVNVVISDQDPVET